MRSIQQPSPRFPAIGAALLLLMCGAAQSFASATPSKLARTYNSEPTTTTAATIASGGTAAKAGPSFSVSLGADGSATIAEDCGKGAVTSFGKWTDSGGEITITFTASNDQPAAPPLILQPSHDGLHAVSWNHATWGKLTPPPLRKESSNWHSRRRHSFL